MNTITCWWPFRSWRELHTTRNMTHQGLAKAQLLSCSTAADSCAANKHTHSCRPPRRHHPLRTSSRDAGSKMRRTFLPTPFFDLGLPATPRLDLVVLISMLRLLLPLLRPRPPPPLGRILPAPARAGRPPEMKHVPAELRSKACCPCGGCACCRCWRGVKALPSTAERAAGPLLKEAELRPRTSQQLHANKDNRNRTDLAGRGRAIVSLYPVCVASKQLAPAVWHWGTVKKHTAQRIGKSKSSIVPPRQVRGSTQGKPRSSERATL